MRNVCRQNPATQMHLNPAGQCKEGNFLSLEDSNQKENLWKERMKLALIYLEKATGQQKRKTTQQRHGMRTMPATK
jgi:hypothetical protein